jgi:Predicted integral membrane protein
VTPILFLKLIHVLLAIVAVGSNVTYGFWLRRAGLDRERLTWTIETVRALDRRIANPAYVGLLVTGLLMVWAGLYPLISGWILAAIGLYVLTALLGIALFAPTIRRQLAEAARDPASKAYAAIARRSSVLGLITTGIVVVIVTLMVTKPF